MKLLFRKSAKEDPEETEILDHHVTEQFAVVGTPYCEKDIIKLAVKNPEWKKNSKELIEQGLGARKIFQYCFCNKPVCLVPEPKNAHDKNAVMVQIAGKKVGYISREENSHVKEIISRHKVKFISAFIGGGAYKIVFENGEVVKEADRISIKIKICYK